MFHVTSKAKSELSERLLEVISSRPHGVPAGLGFRLTAGDSESEPLGLALDLPREDDEIIAYEGRSLLMLDASTARILDDLTLDVVQTPEGEQLGLLEHAAQAR